MIAKGRMLVEKSRRYRDRYPKSSIAYAYEAGYKAAIRDANLTQPKRDPELFAKLVAPE